MYQMLTPAEESARRQLVKLLLLEAIHTAYKNRHTTGHHENYYLYLFFGNTPLNDCPWEAEFRKLNLEWVSHYKKLKILDERLSQEKLKRINAKNYIGGSTLGAFPWGVVTREVWAVFLLTRLFSDLSRYPSNLDQKTLLEAYISPTFRKEKALELVKVAGFWVTTQSAYTQVLNGYAEIGV